MFALISYGLLCSRIVWSFSDNWGNIASWFLSNTYVWVSIALLVGLPIRQLRPAPGDEPGPAGAAAETALSHQITSVGRTSRELAELSVGDRTDPAADD